MVLAMRILVVHWGTGPPQDVDDTEEKTALTSPRGGKAVTLTRTVTDDGLAA